jgi:predicted enzyme related to lactoylglutathione lyase
MYECKLLLWEARGMILAEVCLLTNNVLRLAEFYRTVLNTTSDSDDEVHQEIFVKGAALTIYNDGKEKNNTNQNICIAFTVENVDAEYEKLKKLGIDIIDPPTIRPWGARNMHFCDPDGNHVYFRSFPVN